MVSFGASSSDRVRERTKALGLLFIGAQGGDGLSMETVTEACERFRNSLTAVERVEAARMLLRKHAGVLSGLKLPAGAASPLSELTLFFVTVLLDGTKINHTPAIKSVSYGFGDTLNATLPPEHQVPPPC